MGEVFLRLQAAAGHEGVGDADSGGVAKRYLDVVVIIPLQKAPVNDVEKVILVVVPVFPCNLTGDFFKLVGQSVLPGNTVPLRQG